MSDVTVRAKLKVQSISEIDYGNGFKNKSMKLTAIYGKEGENFGFAKATPSATLEMQVSDETYAAENWKPGDEFYVDFHKVPRP